MRKSEAQKTQEFERRVTEMEIRLGQWRQLSALLQNDAWQALEALVRLRISEKMAALMDDKDHVESSKLRAGIQELRWFIDQPQIPAAEFERIQKLIAHLRKLIGKRHTYGLGQEPPDFESFSKELEEAEVTFQR